MNFARFGYDEKFVQNGCQEMLPTSQWENYALHSIFPG
jgi:hypothetical protein